MKTCISCDEEKPVGSFYTHPTMADGRLGKCKVCCRRDANNNRSTHIDKVRKKDRERGRTQSRKKMVRANAHKYDHLRTEYIRKHRAKHPEAYKARTAVGNAIRAGRLTRDPCEVEGCTRKAHAHHEDYSRPLDVRWLCPEHHGLVHRKEAA